MTLGDLESEMRVVNRLFSRGSLWVYTGAVWRLTQVAEDRTKGSCTRCTVKCPPVNCPPVRCPFFATPVKSPLHKTPPVKRPLRSNDPSRKWQREHVQCVLCCYCYRYRSDVVKKNIKNDIMQLKLSCRRDIANKTIKTM